MAFSLPVSPYLYFYILLIFSDRRQRISPSQESCLPKNRFTKKKKKKEIQWWKITVLFYVIFSVHHYSCSWKVCLFVCLLVFSVQPTFALSPQHPLHIWLSSFQVHCLPFIATVNIFENC